ncbi:DUF1127 domain-containing protein [Oceaniovalibus sp. ACAM 378]|uniref:DUF1127 domain-containing protein n=1 Tax=Oceaniovalibus sp. ACAM 378 TaxID=2599923 RepID=UPI0011DC486F|nr:DUF1127 domain-containing protein [Oceaniovalibus sp. ACAM 378]TYB90358.1 DUF1127 domain-containing protein [Oceaniovalibus sp. ACAM 378]
MFALDTAPSALGLSGRITALALRPIAAFSAWNNTRLTRKSLDRLTDRELDDIGLSRGDIYRL